jgi:hypothetical protein
MMMNEIAPSILKGLDQFKNLCRQFSKFHEDIAKNADCSLVSDRMLEQL